MKTKVDNILQDILSLSPEELVKVKECASQLFGDSPQVATGFSDEAAFVYSHMVEVLKKRGIKSPPLSIFAKTKGAAKLKAHAEDFLEFISSYLHPRKKVERVLAIKMLLNLLCDRVASGNAPLSATTLAAALQHTAAEVDVQFPGYLRSGLLPMLIHSKRITRVRV